MFKVAIAAVILATVGAVAYYATRSAPALTREDLSGIYRSSPLVKPDGPLKTYHLGHSLVGRDMPSMLAQIAGHDFASQLGWGTPLKAHWESGEVINGYETENDHPNFRDAKEALASGEFDVLVLTEMVEIEAAIKYFQSSAYLRKWAEAGWEGNPDLRIYLYESWHELDDPKGWLNRLDKDPETYWEGDLLAKAMAGDKLPAPIYVIPVGRVFAEVVRRIEAGEGVDGVTSRTDFFLKMEDGSQDQIHVNDLGTYLVAMTHFATIYHKSPVGLPRDLLRADGAKADAPGPELAKLIQEVVWEIVRKLPQTGVKSGTE